MRPRSFLRALFVACGLGASWMVLSAGCVSSVDGEEVGEPTGGRRNTGGGEGGETTELPEGDDLGGAAGDAGEAGEGGDGGSDDANVGGSEASGGTDDVGSGGAEMAAGAAGTAVQPPPECVAGSQEIVGTCGKCGDSVRVCRADGTWAPATCTGEGVCKPGEKASADCGNCGTKSRTCTNECTWPTWGSCGGEGVCKPGATKGSSGCDDCEVVTCSSSCKWGSACKLKSGAACAYEGGTNYRCCGNDKWQFCSSACQFYACAACPAGSTGCKAECN
jgi:hypothetical protein